MAKRRTKMAKSRADRRLAKAAGLKNPGGKSNYARKRSYCSKHGLWGFEVGGKVPGTERWEGKPWRKRMKAGAP
jgi:hypothetical protein